MGCDVITDLSECRTPWHYCRLSNLCAVSCFCPVDNIYCCMIHWMICDEYNVQPWFTVKRHLTSWFNVAPYRQTVSNICMLLRCCFYRATLCVTTVFAVARCLSVCLSITLVHCIQVAEDIVKLLSQPDDLDGPLIRFLRSRHSWSWISQKHFVLGTKLLYNTNRKSYPVYRMVPLSMTLSDLWPGFQGRDIFRHWVSQKRHEIKP